MLHLPFKVYLFAIIFYILFINNLLCFSNEEVIRNYYNNVFGGGKESIDIIYGNSKEIEIKSCNINITLFTDFSIVNLTYNIQNNGNNAEIKFGYPFLNAVINKTIENHSGNGVNNRTITEKSSGLYKDFTVYVDGKREDYKIEEFKYLEKKIPYKLGNTKSLINSKIKHLEVIDSYFYIYSMYFIPISFSEGQNRKVNISYITPNYYSIITAKNKKQLEINEDPALHYIYSEDNEQMEFISEKIFNYLLCSSNPVSDNNIEKIKIRLKANIINQEYLKIFPKNYSQKGIKYIWNYKNLIAQSHHNINVKISPLYSEAYSNLAEFNIFPEKKFDEYKSYYEINKKREGLILEYKNEKFFVKSIRIRPDYYLNRHEFESINIPLEFEIEFSNDKHFNNSIKYYKKISLKKIKKSLERKGYISIYTSKGILCKYMKIKVLKSTKQNETIRISELQVN